MLHVPRSLRASDVEATMADGVLRIEFERARGIGEGKGEKVVISAGGEGD